MPTARKNRAMALLCVLAFPTFGLVAMLGGCSQAVIPQTAVCPVPATITADDQAKILALLKLHPDDYIGRLIVSYGALRSQARKCLQAAQS